MSGEYDLIEHVTTLLESYDDTPAAERVLDAVWAVADSYEDGAEDSGAFAHFCTRLKAAVEDHDPAVRQRVRASQTSARLMAAALQAVVKDADECDPGDLFLIRASVIAQARAAVAPPPTEDTHADKTQRHRGR